MGFLLFSTSVVSMYYIKEVDEATKDLDPSAENRIIFKEAILS